MSWRLVMRPFSNSPSSFAIMSSISQILQRVLLPRIGCHWIYFYRSKIARKVEKFMPGKFFLFLCWAVISGAVCVVIYAAQDYALDLPVNHPAIRYLQEPVDDPVAVLIKLLNDGKADLQFGGGALGNLSKLLEHLGINRDSQMLVFSKTSLQATR